MHPKVTCTYARLNVKNLLRDHSVGADPAEPFDSEYVPGPTGSRTICMHAADDGSVGNTAASLVADLCADGSRLAVYWCGFGSPCLGVLLPFSSEGTPARPVIQRGRERHAGPGGGYGFVDAVPEVGDDNCFGPSLTSWSVLNPLLL